MIPGRWKGCGGGRSRTKFSSGHADFQPVHAMTNMEPAAERARPACGFGRPVQTVVPKPPFLPRETICATKSSAPLRKSGVASYLTSNRTRRDTKHGMDRWQQEVEADGNASRWMNALDSRAARNAPAHEFRELGRGISGNGMGGDGAAAGRAGPLPIPPLPIPFLKFPSPIRTCSPAAPARAANQITRVPPRRQRVRRAQGVGNFRRSLPPSRAATGTVARRFGYGSAALCPLYLCGPLGSFQPLDTT